MKTKCEVCGEVVNDCAGIMLSAGNYYEPPDYGCITEESGIYASTITRHENKSGEICENGSQNTDELCKECDLVENPDVDWYEEPDYDDEPLREVW
jgi:hypothetical protein